MDSHRERSSNENVGWGYMILLAMFIAKVVGSLPLYTLGVIFGPYLAEIGNEAKATSIIGSIFNFATLFSGLPGNVLLQKLSPRMVALLGSLFYITGSFSTILASSVPQLIFTFGILEGVGWGLIVATSMTVFNDYFSLKKEFVMSCLRVAINLAEITYPTVSQLCLREYGFRGTTVVWAGLSLQLLIATICLRRPKQTSKVYAKVRDEQSLPEDHLLLNDRLKESEDQPKIEVKQSYVRRTCSKIYDTLDLGLFKETVYANLVIGLSLTVASDMLFVVLQPWILKRSGFGENEVALLITVHFMSDLAGKILLCVLTAFVNVKNRYLQLVAAYAMVIFRLVFLASNSFWWTAVVGGALGFIRCLHQNSMSLVFVENYPKRFVTSYTLFLVALGITNLSYGQVIGLLTSLTDDRNIALITLAVGPCFCAVMWSIEIACRRRK